MSVSCVTESTILSRVRYFDLCHFLLRDQTVTTTRFERIQTGRYWILHSCERATSLTLTYDHMMIYKMSQDESGVLVFREAVRAISDPLKRGRQAEGANVQHT